MSVLDKFLDAIRLNDDYDDEDEFFDDDIEDDYEEEKPKRRFFKTLDDEDDYDEEYVKPIKKKTAPVHQQTKSVPPSKQNVQKQSKPVQAKQTAKVTPMRKKQGGFGMEVCVIRPNSMEDTREIADTLLADCTVVLNVEGIDVEVAQRIIDFSSGACYAINGNLQKVSSYIFILTPSNVEISGDIQDILNDAFELPSIRTDF